MCLTEKILIRIHGEAVLNAPIGIFTTDKDLQKNTTVYSENKKFLKKAENKTVPCINNALENKKQYHGSIPYHNSEKFEKGVNALGSVYSFLAPLIKLTEVLKNTSTLLFEAYKAVFVFFSALYGAIKTQQSEFNCNDLSNLYSGQSLKKDRNGIFLMGKPY